MNFDTTSFHLKKEIERRIQNVSIWGVGMWTAVICQLKWGQIILSGKIHAHFLSEQWVAFFKLFSLAFGLALDSQGKVVILCELKTLWCQQNDCPHQDVFNLEKYIPRICMNCPSQLLVPPHHLIRPWRGGPDFRILLDLNQKRRINEK